MIDKDTHPLVEALGRIYTEAHNQIEDENYGVYPKSGDSLTDDAVADREDKDAIARGGIIKRQMMRKFPEKRAEFLKYVDEAEHMDGNCYWLEFKNLQEVIEDFTAYLSGV